MNVSSSHMVIAFDPSPCFVFMSHVEEGFPGVRRRRLSKLLPILSRPRPATMCQRGKNGVFNLHKDGTCIGISS